MGGHDHPTTGQPQRCGRFGSRFVIPAADVPGALILPAHLSEVELVFAWTEHFDRMSERIPLTSSCSIELVLPVLVA